MNVGRLPVDKSYLLAVFGMVVVFIAELLQVDLPFRRCSFGFGIVVFMSTRRNVFWYGTAIDALGVGVNQGDALKHIANRK